MNSLSDLLYKQFFGEARADAETDKIVVYMGGGVGVGKSTFTKTIFGDSFAKFVSVRPDALLERYEELLKKKTGKGIPEEERPKVVSRSKKAAMKKFEGLTDEFFNVILDRTAADTSKTTADKVKLDRMGFDTYMIFVYVRDFEIALKRNAAREERQEPEQVVLEYHKAALKNIETYRKVFGQNFIAIKNDVRFSDLKPEQIHAMRNAAIKVRDAILDKEPISQFEAEFKSALKKD